MPIREFMRGGHKLITEPTIITKHRRPIGMWIPTWQSVMVVDTKVGTGQTSSR